MIRKEAEGARDGRSVEDRRPNILLITTDEQRYDTIGILGNPLVRTPNLDSLARRGVIFRRGYIQNTVCMPSRACLATGRYVFQHGVEHMELAVNESPSLPPWEKTVAQRLQDSGYETGAFGKIHMIPRGYDETALTMGKGARWRESSGSELGPSQLGPNYQEWLERRRPGGYEEIYRQRREPTYTPSHTPFANVLSADQYVDQWIAESTAEFIDQDRSRPFFAWCGFCGPHTPFDPPEPYASMYDPAEMPVSPLLRARKRGVIDLDGLSRFDASDGDDLIRALTASYWGMVTFVDDMVGRLTEVLSRRGLWDNTMVVFTTDHGAMLGDFGKMGKCTFDEQVIRVPYFVIPPGGQPGAVVDSLVEHVDLVPTMLDYAGVAVGAEMGGMSLRAILDRPTLRPTTRQSILCEYTSNDRSSRSKCLRSERYKYVMHADGRPSEFYDLLADPLELNNVADDETYAAQVRSHAETLLARIASGAPMPQPSEGWTVVPDEIDYFGRPVTST